MNIRTSFFLATALLTSCGALVNTGSPKSTDEMTGKPLDIQLIATKWSKNGYATASQVAPFLLDNAIAGTLTNVGLESYATVGIGLTTHDVRWKIETVPPKGGDVIGNGSRTSIIDAGNRLTESNRTDCFNVYASGGHRLLFNNLLPEEMVKNLDVLGIDRLAQYNGSVVLNLKGRAAAFQIADILTNKPLVPVWSRIFTGKSTARLKSNGLIVVQKPKLIVFSINEIEDSTEKSTKITIYAVDADTGATVWQKVLLSNTPGSFVTSVFVADDDTITALVSGSTNLFTFDFSGNQKWKAGSAVYRNGVRQFFMKYIFIMDFSTRSQRETIVRTPSTLRQAHSNESSTHHGKTSSPLLIRLYL
ncbi:hypothetical protein [Deinococcus sp.]|uniref:hypothetical protein n=1 Tax=Deinococcus sp. TaxID=47478 RepID=UPI003C7BC6D4